MSTEKQPPTLDRQPTLAGTAVGVRPLTPDDADALFAVAADPELWAQHPDRNRWQRPVFDTFFGDAIASGGALAIVDNTTGTVIGTTRLHFTPDNFVEIGWTFVARSHWGGPTNRDVKTLLLDYIFTVEDVVMFRIGADNARSRRAVEKLDAELDRQFETPRGPGVQYRLSAEAWRTNKAGAR